MHDPFPAPRRLARPMSALLLYQVATAQPPELSLVILGAAAVGLIVNTVAILGVALKGGRILGRMETSVEGLTEEVKELRRGRTENAQLITRAVAQLDDLERRVEHLERRNGL
jgi:uncharacterized protein YoxC